MLGSKLKCYFMPRVVVARCGWKSNYNFVPLLTGSYEFSSLKFGNLSCAPCKDLILAARKPGDFNLQPIVACTPRFRKHLQI